MGMLPLDMCFEDGPGWDWVGERRRENTECKRGEKTRLSSMVRNLAMVWTALNSTDSMNSYVEL